MARVRLIDETTDPQLTAQVERLRGARGGRLLNLYRMLLHSPPVADAWLVFNNAIRRDTDVDDTTRELTILRIAMLNGAEYVVRIHTERYAVPAGVSLEQVAALPEWRDSALFDARQRALLAYVDSMTRAVNVPDDVYDALRLNFSEREIVEITVLSGAYNMHTRVLMALKVDPEPT
jgi:alkylhydroperoxidase family enzyme